MAFRRRPRRVFRRLRRFVRRFRRRSRRMQPAVARNRGLLCADRVVLHLKYVDARTFVPGAVWSNYLYNLNSLFDPDRSGTGGVPVGYNQWITLYSRYRVFSVNYRVSFSANSAVAGASMMCVTVPLNGTSVVTSLPQALASRWCKQTFCQYQSNVGRIRGRISLPALNGRTVAEYRGADSCQAAYNASPTEILVLLVGSGSMDQTTGDQVTFTVELTYNVEMFDRNTV